MENPLSWNEYQKAIAFYLSDVPPGRVENIVNGLIKEGFLDATLRLDAIATVEKATSEARKMFEMRAVGLSTVSRVYYALKEAGLLP